MSEMKNVKIHDKMYRVVSATGRGCCDCDCRLFCISTEMIFDCHKKLLSAGVTTETAYSHIFEEIK